MSVSSALPRPSEISAFRQEWNALLECASPHSDAPRLAELIQHLDWQLLLPLAEEHGVLGHLAASLRKLEKLATPPEFQKALSERQRDQALRSLRLTAGLFRVLDCFAANGIAALVVKGPVLSAQAYGDHAMRSYGDIDLLVRHCDIRRATELMIASGYQAKVPLVAIDAGKIPGQYLFRSPDSQLVVELHNDHTLRYFPRRLPLEKCFARQIGVSLDGRQVPALCVEDELVLICIHGAKHFWERLIWIADVAALVTRQSAIDWQRVAASAKEVRAERMLHTGLRLAENLLKVPLAERIARAVKEDTVALQLAQQIFKWLPAAGHVPPSLLERALYRMHMRGGLLSGPAYLLRLSFSPTEEDWQRAGKLSQNGILDALRRPLRLARKYDRGGKD
jgi:Uncharacterised nucleotidyltransferase